MDYQRHTRQCTQERASGKFGPTANVRQKMHRVKFTDQKNS